MPGEETDLNQHHELIRIPSNYKHRTCSLADRRATPGARTPLLVVVIKSEKEFKLAGSPESLLELGVHS
jgi:hypothetical protein